MEIRLISVKEDFEKAFGVLYAKNYHLSFYEFSLRHDYHSKHATHRLIGAFHRDECLGALSYEINPNHVLGKILHIKEIKTQNKSAFKPENIRSELLDFIERIALDEKCDLVKMQYQHSEKHNESIFDRFENYLRSIL